MGLRRRLQRRLRRGRGGAVLVVHLPITSSDAPALCNAPATRAAERVALLPVQPKAETLGRRDPGSAQIATVVGGASLAVQPASDVAEALLVHQALRAHGALCMAPPTSVNPPPSLVVPADRLFTPLAAPKSRERRGGRGRWWRRGDQKGMAPRRRPRTRHRRLRSDDSFRRRWHRRRLGQLVHPIGCLQPLRYARQGLPL